MAWNRSLTDLRNVLAGLFPTVAERAGGTEVTIAFEHIPPGIRPEDNDAGTRSSLAKLARYVEERDG